MVLATQLKVRQWCLLGVLLCFQLFGCWSVYASSEVILPKPQLEFVITEYPPFIGRTLPNNGLVTDICVQAFESLGYSVSVKSYPFARAVYLVKTGAVDGFLGLWYREERESWANYSQPLVSQDMVLVKRVVSPIVLDDWKTLAQYRIGTVLSYVNPEVFDENAVQTEAVSADSINFRKLLYGRIDLALTSRDVAEYLFRQHKASFAKSLEIMPKVLGQESFFFAASKQRANHQELVEQLNLGLLKLNQEGKLAQIFKLHGIAPQRLAIGDKTRY